MAIMPAIVDPLLDQTRQASSTTNAQPYIHAIDLIRAAIARHREYTDSLAVARETSSNIIEDLQPSQSPVGFTNDARTIEAIERILNELDRSHPPPKLSHDSSNIEEDLFLAADDNGQLAAPPVSYIALCPPLKGETNRLTANS